MTKAITESLRASGISISKVDASKGQGRVNDIHLTRKTTDLGFTVRVNRDSMQGFFEINLSAKSMPKATKDGLKKASTTYKSGRPWSRIGQELNLLDTSFDYYFSNLVVKPTSTRGSKSAGALKSGAAAYTAIKNYLSVAYALQAIGGTGIGDDTVTHVVYLNKIMSVVDVISSIAKSNTDLNITLTPSSIAQDSKFVEGDPGKNKYVRSKAVLSEVRKITFAFKK